MKYKNKIKAVFKTIGRVFVVLVGIALIIYLTIDIGAKPPLMANRNARNDTELYSMQDNDNYYTTNDETNFFSFNGYVVDEFIADFQHEDEYEYDIDEIITDPDGIDTYFSIGLYYTAYDFQDNNTEDTRISFNLYNSNENYLNNLDDDKYYYVYTNFEVVPMNNTSSSPEFYQFNNYYISCDTEYLFYEYQYINPIFKGSFLKDNLQSLYCEFDLYFMNRYEYTNFYLRLYLSIFDLQGFVDLNYDEGYDSGYDEGYDSGYDEGFYNGESAAKDNLINYGSFAYLDYIQYGADLDLTEYSFYYLITNDYLNNGILKIDALAENLGLSYSANSIYMSFNELPISYTNLLFRAYDINPGQYNIIVYYDMPNNQTNSVSYTTTNSNFFDLNLYIAPPNALSISEIIIEYSNLESVSNIVSNGGNYNLGYQQGEQNGYDSGYDEGFESGITIGEDIVLENPNEYGLYDEQQYISYGQNQYGSGYNNGLAANGVVGLDWFKASISVVNDFLNIMILPNVTIGNIFAGVIILVILSWVLSWFRG